MERSRTLRPTIATLHGLALCSILAVWASAAWSQESEAPAQPAVAEARRSLSKDPPGMKRLMSGSDVWIDPANKRVVLDGVVCLREGQLEMLACVKGTKEHESILAADTKAFAVHAGLLAVGAQVGTPVQFQPTYKPATGTEVGINLIWTDKNGQVHRDRAQDWVRNVQTGKPMEYQVEFFRNEKGQVSHAVLHQGGRGQKAMRRDSSAPPLPAAKERKEITMAPKLLDGYMGQYQLAPNFILSITREGDSLFAQATGQQKAQLFPESHRDFFFKIVDAQITFETDGNGRASSLTLHQNGANIAAKKID